MKKTYLFLLFLLLCIQVQAQETCDTAIDLGSLTSPYDGTTTGAADDNLISCYNSGEPNTNTSPDGYYSILVPAGSTISMRQTVNTFDSTVVAFYGDCENRTEIICFDDDDYTTVVWANDTGSDQTFYWIQDGYAASSGDFTLEWSVIACTSATADFSITSDCANGEQFLINIDVTGIGSATSVTVADDQGSTPAVLTAAGMVQFGPFPNGTPVVVTVSNDQDSDCILTSPVLNQTACPPANDDPAGAVELVLDLGMECGPGQITGISNDATTGSPEVDPSCIDQYNPSQGNGDLWFYFVAPAETVTLAISDIAGGIFTVSSVLYAGTSGNFTEAGTCDNAYVKTYSDLVPGDTYYLRVWDYANDGIGTFSLCGYYLNCTNATVNYAVVSDCANGDQFLIDVDVTDMGTATSLSISDDQGNATQAATATGVYTFGPYPNGTPVTFTVANDTDSACTLTSNAMTQSICPPVCSEAIPIANCAEEVQAELVAGNGAWNPLSCGYTTDGTELLYSFTPAETGQYDLQITAASGGYIDYFWKEASGSCDQTGWTCIDDNNGPGTDSIGILTVGVEYLILLDGEGTNAKTATFILTCPPTCTNATADYDIVSDCANGEQFFVQVNITDMGTATNMTISDDQGSASQPATATGGYTFGPYANSTPVIFTIANDLDASCIFTSPVQTQVACPPVNDDCDQAIEVLAGSEINEIVTDLSNVGATGSSQPTPAVCFGYSGGDVWYTLAVPPSGNVTIETSNSTTGDTGVDTVVTVYSGTCGSLTQVACDDDGADTGAYSKVIVTGQTPGDMLYLRIYEYNNDNAGGFGLTAYDPSMLGVSGFDNSKFSAYPNPVTNILNLSYTNNISNVEVYNLLGQQVLVKKVNAHQGQIDMSDLAAGSYLVKVASDNEIKTIKVIKQ